LESSIDLNTAGDLLGSKEIAEFLRSINGGILNSLVEHDDSTDVLIKAWGSEKKLSVSLSVFVGVLDTDSIESLTDSSSRLISSKDSLTWGGDVLDGLNEFSFEFS